MMLTFQGMQSKIGRWARGCGWWDGFEEADGVNHTNYIASKLCLVHSEISEALEELRKGPGVLGMYFTHDNPTKPEGLVVELADAVIRMMDLCDALGFDLWDAIEKKQAYNETRPRKHGGKAI